MGTDLEDVESFSDGDSIQDERIQDFEDDFESSEETNAPKTSFTKPVTSIHAEAVTPLERSIDRSKGSQIAVSIVTKEDNIKNQELEEELEIEIEGEKDLPSRSASSISVLNSKQEAATKIQSVYRGHKERKKFKEDLKEKSKAATKIQSQFRGFRERKSFQHKKEVLKKQNKQKKVEQNKEIIKKGKDTKEVEKGKSNIEQPPKPPTKSSSLKSIDSIEQSTSNSKLPLSRNTSILQPISSENKVLQKQVSKIPKLQPSKSQASLDSNTTQNAVQKIEKLTSDLQVKDKTINDLQENIKALNKQIETFTEHDEQDSFTKYQKLFSQEQKLVKERELLLNSVIRNFEASSKSSSTSKDKKEVWRGELVKRNQLVMEKHKHIQSLEQTISNMKTFHDKEKQSHLNRIHDLENLVHKLRREKLEISMMESKATKLPKKLFDDLSTRNHATTTTTSSLPPIKKT